MKTYKRESNGVKVTVYNDSGAVWVVEGKKNKTRWPINKFTMKDAVASHCEIFPIN